MDTLQAKGVGKELDKVSLPDRLPLAPEVRAWKVRVIEEVVTASGGKKDVSHMIYQNYRSDHYF